VKPSISSHLVGVLLALILVGMFSRVGLAQPGLNQTSQQLALRGKVISFKAIPDSPSSRYSSTFLEMKLQLELVNTSRTPIIFLNRDPRFVGAVLAKRTDDFETGNYLARTYVGPAVSLSPKWKTLRAKLNKRTPPADEIRILMPNESWSVTATVGVSLPDHPELFAPELFGSARSISFTELQRNSTVWLRVLCEVWPWNIEPGSDRSRLTYGRKLQRRWKTAGILWLDEIFSDPIDVPLKRMQTL